MFFKHAPELEVIAEGARADMRQAARREEDRRRRQRDHGDPLAVPDGFAADRLTRYRVEHADQVGRHGDGLAVAMRHDPFVLEIDGHDRAAPVVHAVEAHDATQKTLGRAAFDVDHLAPVQKLARLDRQDGGDGIFVLALGFAHGVADGHGLGGRAVDAPLLDLRAGARRLAGGGDRAVFDADLARHPLGPFPGRNLVDDRLEAAHVARRQRIRL